MWSIFCDDNNDHEVPELKGHWIVADPPSSMIDGNELLRKIETGQPLTAEEGDYLVDQDHHEQIVWEARYHCTSKTVLRAWATSEQEDIVYAVVMNWSCPRDVLELLATHPSPDVAGVAKERLADE